MAGLVECGQRVEGQNMAYPCCIEQGHEGPCACREVDRTMRARARWQEGEKAKATMAGFQGEALTTAQRNTENPTAVPRSKGQKANDAQDARDAAQDALEATQEAERLKVEGVRQRMREEAVTRAQVAEEDLAVHRANLVAVIGEEGVQQIEAGVAGGMAAALEVMAATQSRAPVGRDNDPWGTGGGFPPGTPGNMGGAPTKQRKGDQRLPLPRATPAMHVLVAQDLAQRLRVGMERYGQPLQALNGRNALQDAYEEVLDTSVYLRQIMEERQAMAVLASTLRNRLGYLERALADLQVEAHTTYDEKGPLEDTPVDVLLVHPEEMEAIDRLVAWLTA